MCFFVQPLRSPPATTPRGETHVLHASSSTSYFFADRDARDEVVWIIPMRQPHEHTLQAGWNLFVWVMYT